MESSSSKNINAEGLGRRFYSSWRICPWPCGQPTLRYTLSVIRKAETRYPYWVGNSRLVDNFFMCFPLVTERLILREFRPDDLERLFWLYRLPETSRYERWEPLKQEDEARKILDTWIKQQSEAPRHNYSLAVELKGNNTFIGLCGLERGFSVETPNSAEIGFVAYRYFPNYWNKGYATEALRAVLQLGFTSLGLHRIHSGCAEDNAASARVLAKAGMRHEGTTRSSMKFDNEWHDFLVFGILPDESS